MHTLRSVFQSLFYGALPLAALCMCLSPGAATRAADLPATQPDLRLPVTDFHYKQTKPYVEEQPVPEYQHASPAAFEAFEDIKYGIRIHWGIYSIWARANESWPFLTMTPEDKQKYQELYKTWNPTGFDAEEWMKVFKDNGLQMFAFTAKHHEGFSMFDTKTHVKQRINWTTAGGPALEDYDLAYSIMDTPFHRDVVKELCDAGHKYGIKIDLYFSNPDWYDADFRPYGYHPVLTPAAKAHPDEFGSALVTEKTKQYFMTGSDVTPAQAQRMMERYRQQLTELLTHYGKIDMVCLDNWFGKANWPEMRQTILALRKIQPDVMLRAPQAKHEGFFHGGMIPSVLVGSAAMAASSLGLGAFAHRSGDPHWQTLILTSIVFSSLLLALSARSNTRAIWALDWSANRPMLVAVSVTFVAHLLAVYAPLAQRLLKTQALPALDLGLAAGSGFAALIVVELWKWRLRLAQPAAAQRR